MIEGSEMDSHAQHRVTFTQENGSVCGERVARVLENVNEISEQDHGKEMERLG